MFQVLETMQILVIIRMSKNQFTHIYVAGSFGIFVAQITQLADYDVDQDVQIVSVKEFMTVFVLEYVHDDFLGSVNIACTFFNVCTNVSVFTIWNIKKL